VSCPHAGFRRPPDLQPRRPTIRCSRPREHIRLLEPTAHRSPRGNVGEGQAAPATRQQPGRASVGRVCRDATGGRETWLRSLGGATGREGDRLRLSLGYSRFNGATSTPRFAERMQTTAKDGHPPRRRCTAHRRLRCVDDGPLLHGSQSHYKGGVIVGKSGKFRCCGKNAQEKLADFRAKQV
jgi:hypothetical protein